MVYVLDLETGQIEPGFLVFDQDRESFWLSYWFGVPG